MKKGSFMPWRILLNTILNVLKEAIAKGSFCTKSDHVCEAGVKKILHKSLNEKCTSTM